MRLIITLITCLCFFTIGAQQYFFKNYSVESGLPFVQVSCSYQDEKGYLWSGGNGGLSRFDGKAFVNYNRRNGLVDHNVNAITGDPSGRLFVGTNKGLSILYEKKFTSYTQFPGLSNPYITSLCRGFHHAVYIGTTSGLFMYKDNAVKPVKKLAGYKISFLYNPDTTVLFIGTDRGLVLYGHNSFRVIGAAQGLASNDVKCITRFRNSIVIGTASGLSFYDLATGKITSYYSRNGLIDEHITALTNQHDSVLWIGAEGGLLGYNGETWNYYRIRADNNSNHIRCILNDREDNIWLGTHSGLFRYRDNSFSTFENVPGLGNAFVFQIGRDRNGNLWVCSENNGIFRASEGFFRRYANTEGLNTNSSKAMIETSDGKLFFGTATGLYQFRNERFHKIHLPPDFKPPIEVMYEAHDKTLYIGGANGFVELRNDKRQSMKFHPLRTATDYGVYGFCEDDERNLYIGTFRGGLLQLRNDTLVNLSRQLHLNEETFFTLRYTGGRIFAASLNGVLVLNTKTNELKRITDDDGLNSELVYSIELTRNNRHLWIGTNQGINKLDVTAYLSTDSVALSSFGKHEGFAGVECNSNGIWEDADGTLWFGTVSGLIKHQPFHYKKNTVPNKTVIQSIRIMNEDTLLADSSRLASQLNTIGFYYRGICLTNPDKVLYQRKLEGLEQDKNWSEPGDENYIKYTNLAPGRYTFRIRSANNEGIWNEEATSFTFYVKRPFYTTWWFLLLSFLVLFGTIYAIFMIRIFNIKKKQRIDFERKVEMSRIELKALRSQMNPHFVFNSLNAIQHYIFNTKSDEAIKYLNKFARLVRIILNNSDKPTVTVGEDLEALKLYLELEQMRFEEKFDYELIIDESVDPDYDIMPPLLMQPYVENAILHGLNPKPEKGKLTIKLHSENNFLICTITDNGIGREKASEIRRTMPFRNHKSLGMKITEERLRILNEINSSHLSVTITDLKDEDGKALGTKVELFVPLSG